MAKARDGGYATSGSEEVSSDSEARWVSWFCGLKGNEFFCEVDEDFIQDDFNLCSLATQVTYYNYALGACGASFSFSPRLGAARDRRRPPALTD